jgi:uncharacterized DUF497 family protein
MNEKKFEFDIAKSAWLRKQRGIGFEEIITLIEAGKLLASIDNPNQDEYAQQKIYLIDIEQYVWLVPYINRGDVIRLITCYPSRKITKKWLKENSDGKK